MMMAAPITARNRWMAVSWFAHSSEHELRSYEEDVREHISQFTDEELTEAYELDRTTLNSLAPRAAVLMRKYIDNDDSWTYHRDYAISEAVSEYKEDKDNG